MTGIVVTFILEAASMRLYLRESVKTISKTIMTSEKSIGLKINVHYIFKFKE